MSGEGAINMEFGGDNAKAIRAMSELEAANAVLTSALKAVQKEAEKAGKQQESAAKRAAEAAEKLRERNAALSARLEDVDKKAKVLNGDYEKMQREVVGLSRANDDLIRRNEKLTTGMEQLGHTSERAGQKGTGALQAVAMGAKSAVGMLLGGTGLLAALGLVSKSLDDLEARGKAAKGAATTVEGAEASVANNIPSTGDPWKDAAITKDVIERGRMIAAERQVPVLDVMNAISGGLSASGGNVEATLQATYLQSELNRANPGEMRAGVEGTVNVARIMGTQNAFAAQGVLELIGANSAIRDPGKISENATPVLSTAKAFNFDLNEVGAFFSTMTQEQADSQGDRSRSASISFVSQIASFFNDGAGARLNKGAMNERGTGLGFGEMIAALQDNPRLREEFQKGLSLELPAVGPVKQLLENVNSSFSVSMFDAMSRTPPDEAGLEALVSGRRARLSAVPSTVIGDAGRALAAAREQAQLGDVSAQAAGLFNSEELDAQLAAGGVQWADRAIASAKFKGKLLMGADRGSAFSETISGVQESFAAGDPERTRNLATNGTNAEMLAKLNTTMSGVEKAANLLREEMERKRQSGDTMGAGRVPVRNP